MTTREKLIVARRIAIAARCRICRQMYKGDWNGYYNNGEERNPDHYVLQWARELERMYFRELIA